MSEPETCALPLGFTDRMRRLLGAEYPAFLASYDKPRRPALRVNPLRLDGIPDGVRALLPFLAERVPFTADGWYYPDDPALRPGRHPYHEAGLYYIQEASAMIPAALCPPRPGERVLDLCAAPGGKATQLAGALRGQGLLVANEIHPGRAAVLSGNIERMGIPNALVLNMEPQALAERFPGFFDRIVVDAPCSGEGMFRKEPQAVQMWSPENIALCAARQAEILRAAARMLAPGGTIVYSTCTFAPEEDEGSVLTFLREHPDFDTVMTDASAILACLADGRLDAGRPDWVPGGTEYAGSLRAALSASCGRGGTLCRPAASPGGCGVWRCRVGRCRIAPRGAPRSARQPPGAGYIASGRVASVPGFCRQRAGVSPGRHPLPVRGDAVPSACRVRPDGGKSERSACPARGAGAGQCGGRPFYPGTRTGYGGVAGSGRRPTLRVGFCGRSARRLPARRDGFLPV